jgi:hypothetical protein
MLTMAHGRQGAGASAAPLGGPIAAEPAD